MPSKAQLDKIVEVWGKIPKVLVGAPHHAAKDYMLERYAERVKDLDYPNYDILIADNSEDSSHTEVLTKLGLPAVAVRYSTDARKRLKDSRNVLRDYALTHGYDFFFDYETDIIAPRHILTELLQWGKEVIGGWYYIGFPGHAKPCLSRPWMNLNTEEADRAGLYRHMAQNRLMRVCLGAMGVQLIHRSVMEQVEFEFIPMWKAMDDSVFYMALEQMKIPVWIDTEMLCPHFSSDWAAMINKPEEVEEKWQLQTHGTK